MLIHAADPCAAGGDCCLSTHTSRRVANGSTGLSLASSSVGSELQASADQCVDGAGRWLDGVSFSADAPECMVLPVEPQIELDDPSKARSDSRAHFVERLVPEASGSSQHTAATNDDADNLRCAVRPSAQCVRLVQVVGVCR